MSEEWDDELLLYLYDTDGSPIGMQYRNTSYAEGVFDTYWFEKNLQGDIVAVYDEDGTKLVTYTYDAWGNCTVKYFNIGASTAAFYNPFRYRGYYLDTETGFYYLNSRYYDPAIGRFITPDKFSTIKATPLDLTDKNLYAYCDNNPVTRRDDGGAFWGTFFDVVSLVCSVVDVIQDPKDPLNWIGLAGDIIDLAPVVSGVGEISKAVSKGLQVIDDGHDSMKVVGAYNDVKKFAEGSSETLTKAKKLTGSYTIEYKGGKYYDGKGGLKRALHSAQKHSTNGGKDIVSIEWKSASSTRQAFIDEYIRMCKHGGPNNSTIQNMDSLNQIWSPGRKYHLEDFGKYYSYGGKLW